MSPEATSKEDDGAIFKALADSRRRKLLDLLKTKPRTTGELCSYFKDLDRCTVILHLEVLRKAGLIIVRKEGRFRWNYLDALPIKRIHDRWIGKYADFAVEMLDRIKQNVEITKNQDNFES